MKEVIREAINDVLKELGLSGADFSVEHPTELLHGLGIAEVFWRFCKQGLDL